MIKRIIRFSAEHRGMVLAATVVALVGAFTLLSGEIGSALNAVTKALPG